MLRTYQKKAIQDLYAWFEHHDGHPCLVLPTGSGKSHIIAELCRDAIQSWPDTRILMLTHVKELIEQDAAKLRQHWPNAPLGIYSAGIGKRELGEPITFASIQSIRNHDVGHIDLCIIDECFPADTMISTPNGEKKISEIECGDKVFHALGTGTVDAVSKRTARNIFTLELEDGSIIRCTGNHRFFTDTGWREAKTLENGSHLFSQEGVRLLQRRVYSLDKIERGWDAKISNPGKIMGKAEVLLAILCQESQESDERLSFKVENEGSAQGNKTQTDTKGRKWQTAAASTTCPPACARGRLGSRSSSPDQNEAPESRVSNELQDRYRQQGEKDWDRTGWIVSLLPGTTRAGQEKDGVSYFPRVVNISSIQQPSPVLVYNLQVSGHPSFYAGGKLVHNCHLVNHKAEGVYRSFITTLQQKNPNLRVIGLTATPYRMGHGLITDDPALFDDLIEPVTIEELQDQGYLADLRSKVTRSKLSPNGVARRGGDYVEKDLQRVIDVHEKTEAVIKEVIELVGDRTSWLFFCTGVDHARHVKDVLLSHGVAAECITGATEKRDRQRIITAFKAGKIRALTNANVLTTGFDHPDIDLIVMMRPTLSPGLYTQMAGRGLRLKSHTDHCLVLDFAGVVEMHGPITSVRIPKAHEQSGDALPPSKICPECDEIIAAQCRTCPRCGYGFPITKHEEWILHDDDIMGRCEQSMKVSGWYWNEHTSKKTGREMVKVTYFGSLLDRPVTEYLCLFHEGYAGKKALGTLKYISARCGVSVDGTATTNELCERLSKSTPPIEISYRKEGQFHRVLQRVWDEQHITDTSSMAGVPARRIG